MTLHQQILTSAPIDRSIVFRSNALLCEQRASGSADRKSKQDWADLAIEWHFMAYHTALPRRDAQAVTGVCTVASFGEDRLIEFGRFAAKNRKRRGLGKPETFTFL